jgi:haloacetate dehalogenase
VVGRTRCFAPEAVAEYLRCFRDPEVVRASGEDYRAGASIDLEHDETDAAAGRRVECPALALDGGHYPAEEAPDATLHALRTFPSDASGR